ncbi:MAG: hypothetical protein C4575_07350 [Desulforudis sp.]|jgi:hypothetical protein|nr:MAG: hypothetical protein C4575_07350 [Desulforudis sp.]
MPLTPTPAYGLLPIDGLKLDYRNPRIARLIEIHGKDVPAEQIALALGSGDSSGEGENYTTYFSLKSSIKTQGGLITPIIVNREKNGDLVVIEGNTRAQIFRELREAGVPGNWDSIPAILYDDLPDEEIHSIRLQAHLVGPRPWEPYSKAKYLNHLYHERYLTIEQIIEYCGGKQQEVHRYISAYQDMEKYYRPILDSDDEFDPSRFSGFVELQKSNITKAILDAGFDKTDFSNWIKDDLIYPLWTARKLPPILRDDQAREIFLREGAQEALKVLDAPDTEQALSSASIVQLARELARKIGSLPYDDLMRLRGATAEDDRADLYDAKEHLESLLGDLED